MLFNKYLQYLHISGYKPKRVLCGYRIYIVKTIEFFFSLSVKNFASRLTRKMDFVDFLRLWSTQWKELRPSNEELIMKNQVLLLQLLAKNSKSTSFLQRFLWQNDRTSSLPSKSASRSDLHRYRRRRVTFWVNRKFFIDKLQS